MSVQLENMSNTAPLTPGGTGSSLGETVVCPVLFALALPLGCTKGSAVVSIEPANTHHFAEVLEWLKTEKEQGGTGFYCNRNVIERSFSSGEGLCAIAAGRSIGFAVFQMFTDGGDVHIIEVEPSARGQGLGSQLLLAAVEVLRGLGAKYVHVECTSAEGEALCRRHGFEDYVDPHNYRSEWDNPLSLLQNSPLSLIRTARISFEG